MGGAGWDGIERVWLCCIDACSVGTFCRTLLYFLLNLFFREWSCLVITACLVCYGYAIRLYSSTAQASHTESIATEALQRALFDH